MPKKSHVFVKDLNKLICLPVNDIFWVEADARKVFIHYKEGVLHANSSLSKVVRLLDDTVLVRIHKSYAVNINKVENIKNGQVHLEDKSINIGRKYMPLLKERFERI